LQHRINSASVGGLTKAGSSAPADPNPAFEGCALAVVSVHELAGAGEALTGVNTRRFGEFLQFQSWYKTASNLPEDEAPLSAALNGSSVAPREATVR